MDVGGKRGVQTLKELVNACPNLYFIKKEYIGLRTWSVPMSSYPAAEGRAEYEKPIRFLSGPFVGVQTRWPAIENEEFAEN